MDPRLPTEFGGGYKSASQRARRITEPWATDNLYCCACPQDSLRAEPTNNHVTDLFCPDCAEEYQLKSQRRIFAGRILGSNYARMLDAIRRNRVPNFFLLHYRLPEWLVHSVCVIPRFAISPSAVLPRKPLAATARRSNWIGYTLNLALIPASAKILMFDNGVEISREEVRAHYARIARVASLNPTQRGWTLDVLRCIEALPNATFTNEEVYAFEADLAKLYPDNRHIREKIRQQLQVLRNRGLLRQPSRGVWQRV